MPVKGFSILPEPDAAGGGAPDPSAGYWSLLTTGDPIAPELIFDGDGDVIAVWTETP
jgi:hypothetical protein